MSPEPAAPEPGATEPGAVAITGVSGLLGQRLLALLDAQGATTRIVGIDVREPPRRSRSLQFHLLDLTTAELAPVLSGVDTVVHLAAVVGPVADEDLARHVNIDGTRRLLAAVEAAGVRKIVRASSAAVYGAWPNNAVPLSEDAALRPNPGFAPAAHDAENERLLADWHAKHPETVATVLRIAPVVGAGARTLWARVAAGRAPASVRGTDPPIQVVHVDDAASARALAVSDDLDGVFNVAADGWLSHDEAAAVAPHRRPPAVPEEVADRALRALWATGVGDAPPAVLPYLMYPWVLANDRLKSHGWAPRHTNEEAILLAGDPEARRRPLPWIAAVGAVLTGAGGATWWLTHRRRVRG
jgi:nucleoside-diphosphate-sugar epimerase